MQDYCHIGQFFLTGDSSLKIKVKSQQGKKMAKENPMWSDKSRK
jgi:hypothetical protein